MVGCKLVALGEDRLHVLFRRVLVVFHWQVTHPFFGLPDQNLTCKCFLFLWVLAAHPFLGPAHWDFTFFFSFFVCLVLVMALQRTAVFNCGAFLRVCSRYDIAQAFYAAFSDYHTVVSIQVVPGKVVKVCFGSSESTKAVCAEKSYVIDGVECEVLSFAQRVTLGQVHHYPAEADDKDLERVLSDFGDFVEICDQHWVKLTTVTTGTHLSSIKLVWNIPRPLKMEKSRLKV